MQLTAPASAARFLIASDPGRLRLRSASATTLSLVLALVAMLAFTGVSHQPVTVAMMGTIAAMQSSAAVKDRQQRSRVITTLLLFVPATAAISLAVFCPLIASRATLAFNSALYRLRWTDIVILLLTRLSIQLFYLIDWSRFLVPS